MAHEVGGPLVCCEYAHTHTQAHTRKKNIIFTDIQDIVVYAKRQKQKDTTKVFQAHKHCLFR